ncbi:glycosyl hydrolase [Bacillus sp. SA1-12]|uniref:glycoside hydrolase family 88 protein n=1 Tax=Bacillus sp. SA1-12 TaxID=1455638 RepID=UPI0006273B56|nr:glycoside hydrolase family 88 protein [Bacillus sp. SA1-12]KKI89385.1 glycosyl hydrolase [Bacillus sp. SA1-12]
MNSGEQWSNDTWERIYHKVKESSRRIGTSFPHASVDGVYDSMRSSWWTAGFWPGILWQIVADNGDTELQRIAEECELRLDESLYDLSVHHDSGFIWGLSAVANYQITGSNESRHRGFMAASQLASRFNLKGRYIRAWHDDKQNGNRSGWSIIDTMMNLSLLYWASETTNDPRFKHIAMAHADTVLTHFLRPDGSSYHILCFDPETGERIGARSGQGYSEDSAWSRGSAWTIYGLVNSYLHTREKRYLNGAKQAAHFFIANLPEDFVPYWDFRAPLNENAPRDSSAGACAACGLIELSKVVSETEANLYRNAAERILHSLDVHYGAWDSNEEGLITKGTSNFPGGTHINTPLIYGDYYFVEGISKLRGSSVHFW